MHTSPRVVLLLALLLAACAGNSSARPETGGLPARRDADSLSQAEIVAASVSDAYDAVRVLRPAWLRTRGPKSFTRGSGIVVYVDNMEYGGLETLRSLPLASIVRMQFLDASSATQRWGTNHVHGAILVQTM